MHSESKGSFGEDISGRLRSPNWRRKIRTSLQAPGNGAAIDGLKVVTESGWFAARPSGTEESTDICGELPWSGSFALVSGAAQTIVNDALR